MGGWLDDGSWFRFGRFSRFQGVEDDAVTKNADHGDATGELAKGTRQQTDHGSKTRTGGVLQLATSDHFKCDSATKSSDENAEDEKEAFTRLRQIMVELHKPDDQHFFLRREMAAKALMGPWYDRWITKGYGLIADYGWSMLRPVVGLAALWVVGWLLDGLIVCVWGKKAGGNRLAI